MLHRIEPEGTVVVAQPAHAWLSAQLARAWAEPFEPREEVCLAAEQHDVGWTAWETAPELDPETGLPYTFSTLPPVPRLALWSGAAGRVVPQSRYAALLVSLHGTLLVERFPPRGSAEVEEAATAFLAGERAFQERVLETLRRDEAYEAHVAPAAVERNRELVFTWDGLSLALVHGVREERRAVGHRLVPRDGVVEVSPWPFRADEVTVACEGRLLRGPYGSEREMRRALAEAPWTTVRTRLTPA